MKCISVCVFYKALPTVIPAYITSFMKTGTGFHIISRFCLVTKLPLLESLLNLTMTSQSIVLTGMGDLPMA
jgi:hypothetical protein